MPMFFLSRRWTVVVTLATVVKIVLIILTPPAREWGDFYNWVLNSQQVLLVVSSGHLASLWGMGAYLGLSVLVSPLLWLWSGVAYSTYCAWRHRSSSIAQSFFLARDEIANPRA